MTSQAIRQITILSVYLGLIMALTFIPYTGYIQIGPLAITTIPIFVAMATYHQGWKGTIIAGSAFALGSYLRAVTLVPSLMINPIISVAPRLVMSIFIYIVYLFLKHLKQWKFIILGVTSVILNSFFVSVFYFIVQLYDSAYKDTFLVWITLIYINFIVEIAASIVISVPLYKILIIQIHMDEKFINNIYL